MRALDLLLQVRVLLLQARSLDSVAAADPTQEGRYIAALVFPKSQILAIAGNYSVPQLLNERLLKKAYRDTYVEINRAADREGRLFVQDLTADGLRAVPQSGASPDVIYRDTANSIMFTGDWKSQSMTQKAYMEAFSRADAEYAELLRVLIEELKPAAPKGPAQPYR